MKRGRKVSMTAPIVITVVVKNLARFHWFTTNFAVASLLVGWGIHETTAGARNGKKNKHVLHQQRVNDIDDKKPSRLILKSRNFNF
jgi:hypothetical protein